MAEDDNFPEEIEDDTGEAAEQESPDSSETPQRRWTLHVALPRPHISRRTVLQWAVAIALTVLVVVVFSQMLLEPLFFDDEPGETDRPVFPANSEWPSDVAVTPHTVPAIIRNELSARGEQHGYEFEGAAGQVWRITVDPLETSALDPVISLYGPSGDELVSSDDRSAENIGSELRFTLPANGIYRLLVKSSLGGISTGGYWMEVWIE